MRPHTGPIDHHSVHVMHVGDGTHDPVPVARIAPSVEAIVDRCWPTVFAGQISPGEAGAQDIKNAVDHAAVIHPLLAPRVVGQGKSGEITAHSSSVTSLGYRLDFR